MMDGAEHCQPAKLTRVRDRAAGQAAGNGNRTSRRPAQPARVRTQVAMHAASPCIHMPFPFFYAHVYACVCSRP